MDDENLFRLMEEEEHMAVRSSSPASAHPWPGALLRGEEEREHEGSAAHGDDRRRGGHVRHQASLLEKIKFTRTEFEDLSVSWTLPWLRITRCGIFRLSHFSGKIFQFDALVFWDDSTTLFIFASYAIMMIESSQIKIVNWFEFSLFKKIIRSFFLQNSTLNKKLLV